jgi:hypothetical protein
MTTAARYQPQGPPPNDRRSGSVINRIMAREERAIPDRKSGRNGSWEIHHAKTASPKAA